jgi:hypothetical protein
MLVAMWWQVPNSQNFWGGNANGEWSLSPTASSAIAAQE